MPRIAAILIYPVEGCRGLRVKSCGLTARGLDGDRRWKVKADEGALTPEALARVFIELKGTQLWASAAGMDRLLLDAAAPAAASTWFTRLLERAVTCLRLADDEKSGPLLATTTASLAALNQQLPKSVAIDAFRPNLVLEGTDAFAEEAWASIKVGGAQCSVAPNPHILRPQFGIRLSPLLSGAAIVQLRPGQGLDVALKESP